MASDFKNLHQATIGSFRPNASHSHKTRDTWSIIAGNYRFRFSSGEKSESEKKGHPVNTGKTIVFFEFTNGRIECGRLAVYFHRKLAQSQVFSIPSGTFFPDCSIRDNGTMEQGLLRIRHGALSDRGWRMIGCADISLSERG